MSAHDWFLDHRGEYATGDLPAAELARFSEHLTHCADCRAEVEQLERELAWLPMGASPVSPPPGLTRRLTEAVLQSRPRRRWVVPAAAAAALLLATLAGWQARGTTLRLTSEVDRLTALVALTDAQLAATLDTLSTIRAATRVVRAELGMAGAGAGLIIFEDRATQRWTVVVHGLPDAPAGERFALWFVCERGMREGAALPTTLSGTAVLVMPIPQDLGAVLAASITRESLPAEAGAMPERKLELLNLRL